MKQQPSEMEVSAAPEVVNTPSSTSLASGSIATDSNDPRFMQLRRYVAIARPSHYSKNVLVIVGAVLSGMCHAELVTTSSLIRLAVGLIATCLIASSNYVLNEILDAKNDRFHKAKRGRPLAAGHISRRIAFIEWGVLAAFGLLIASTVSWSFFVCALSFQLMAIAYNVPPVRLKDIPYIDVLSEAVNSPIRVLLGWLAVSPTDRPSISLILAFWMAGALLMARKRFREFHFLGDRATAALYRKSFAHYDEQRLKISMFLCAIAMLISGGYEAWKLIKKFV
ncbi:MAG: UbiA prenyltransferase family protein [Planctomycetaceae bacterium]